ncbi:mucin TcMUC [Trypanosoma cruzi cruzi]|nr:mucin TcMUC [Trypanosoma cruzi cruzi]
MPGALQPYGGATVGPQTESGRDSEEGLRSPGPSLPKEAGTAITGQTRAPPESLSSASDNPEPAGLATQSPHTHEVRPVCQMHKIKGAVNTRGDENHKAPTTMTTTRTVTSSRNRRQPQRLCVGVCPAAARRIRAGVHHCGLKRCVWAVRASTQSWGFVRFYCGLMYKV